MKNITLPLLLASFALSSCVVPAPPRHGYDSGRVVVQERPVYHDNGRPHQYEPSRSDAYNRGYSAGRADYFRRVSPNPRYAFSRSGLRNGELTFRQGYEDGYRLHR